MNCKSGDLAIIVASSHSPENIGRIVEVVRPAVRNLEFHKDAPDTHAWIVKADRPLVRHHYLTKERLPDSCVRPYLDDCLRPVSGLPITDDIKDEVTA